MKAFEDSLKKKTEDKTPTKSKPKRTTKSKKAKVDESVEDNASEEDPSVNNGMETSQNEGNGTLETTVPDESNDDEMKNSRVRSICTFSYQSKQMINDVFLFSKR